MERSSSVMQIRHMTAYGPLMNTHMAYECYLSLLWLVSAECLVTSVTAVL